VAPQPVVAPAVSSLPTNIATRRPPITSTRRRRPSSIRTVLCTVTAPIKRAEPTETSVSSTTNRCPVVAFHDDVQVRHEARIYRER